MRNIVFELHKLFKEQKRYIFPFAQFIQDIPQNGIYIIFENGEKYESLDRIVRVGTHTGSNQLPNRLNQHFINENKNRSIFRKNIGRCFLNKENSSYSSLWEIDTTSRVKKEKYLKILDPEYEKRIEKQISHYMQTNLSFCVFQLDSKENRDFWESKIVSTLASSHLQPSVNWLGNNSPKEKIRFHGLWQVNNLYKKSLTEEEFDQLKEIIKHF